MEATASTDSAPTLRGLIFSTDDLEGTFKFHEDNFQSSSFSTFAEMRECDELCDLMIKVGSSCFTAHSLVLASVFPHLRNVFGSNSNAEVTTKKEITLESTDALAMKCLIDFTYTNYLNTAGINVRSLLQTSVDLQLDYITDSCRHFLSVPNQDTFEFSMDGLQSECFRLFADMRQTGELCDITIRVEDEYITAHRLVLASVIPYFRAMFRSNMRESIRKDIMISNVDPAALKQLIDFAYTGNLEISSANLRSLFDTSMYLQLDSVIEACLRFLAQLINPNNVFTLHAFAKFANNADMIENANRYIRENFDDVSMSEQFLELPFQTLEEIIRRNDLNVMTEEVVFECVIRWVRASETDRKMYLPNLLLCIRMPLLNPGYLTSRVSTEILIRASPPCLQMVDEAIGYNLLGKYISRLHGFTAQERHCKEKHHLRCAKLKGCGVYAFVSFKKNTVRYYDPINNVWTPLCVSAGNYRYIACTEDMFYIIDRRTVHLFHFKTLEWSSVALDVKIPLNSAVIVHHNQIYFFGGSSRPRSFALNLVQCLDLQSGTCVRISGISKKRIFPGAALLEENVYITGGYNNNIVYHSVERYNMDTKESIRVSPMNSKRATHGCTSVGGKIYVCGGQTMVNYDSFTNTSEVYDPLADQWSFISNIHGAELFLHSFPYAGKLYVAGTFTDSRGKYVFKVYDPSEDKWRRIKTLPSMRYVVPKVVSTNTAVLGHAVLAI